MIAGLALQEPGTSLLWLVPIVALTTLALVAWMGLVRAAFGADRAARPGARREDPGGRRGVRGPLLRAGLDAQSAQVLALRGADSGSATAPSPSPTASRVLAHAGLGADHHGAGPSRAAGRRRRDDRAARRAPAGRLGPRLRRPRLPAASRPSSRRSSSAARRSARSCSSPRAPSRSRIAIARSRRHLGRAGVDRDLRRRARSRTRARRRTPSSPRCRRRSSRTSCSTR